jgi:hypothetical protein
MFLVVRRKNVLVVFLVYVLIGNVLSITGIIIGPILTYLRVLKQEMQVSGQVGLGAMDGLPYKILLVYGLPVMHTVC